MTMVQVDLSQNEDRKVEIHKAKKGLPNKAEAIRDIIKKFKER